MDRSDRLALSPHRLAAFYAALALCCAFSPFAAAEPLPQPEATEEALPEPSNAAVDIFGCGGELWLIDTRETGQAACPADDTCLIRYWRGDEQCTWQAASLEELAACAPSMPTICYFHGNNNNAEDALKIGLSIHRRFVTSAAACAPFRMVIWSWPSERIPGSVRRNFRIKASMAEEQGYYLAWVLGHLPPDACVALCGHSYGARLISAGLHLLAGGQIDSVQPTCGIDARRPRLRAILTGAALDNDWLLTGRRHGLALTQVERMLVATNSSDTVLRFYSLLYERGGPKALGYTGIPNHVPVAPCGGLVEQFDVQHFIGHGHMASRYYGSQPIIDRVVSFALEPCQAAPLAPIGEMPTEATVERLPPVEVQGAALGM